jgi:threonine-phosphate decarboxylase
VEDIVDMSSNINPLGPPPGLLEHLKSNISAATRLPEVDSSETVKRFAGHLDIDPDRVLAGNGTTQFIHAMPHILEIRRATILGPTYSDYEDACNLAGVPFSRVTAKETTAFHPDLDRLERNIAQADTVFLCNPNNPTGAYIDRAELKRLCARHPKTRFVIDESYLPFIDAGRAKSMLGSGLENVIVLLSISKIFAIPGLRIGFIAAPVEMIDHFRRYLPPWSVNTLAHAAVAYLTANEGAVRSFIGNTRQFVDAQRWIFDGLVGRFTSFRFFPSSTPFFMVKLPAWTTAGNVRRHLAGEKILIRDCSNFAGLSDQFIRISLKSEKANRMLAEKLGVLVEQPSGSHRSPETRRRIYFK